MRENDWREWFRTAVPNRGPSGPPGGHVILRGATGTKLNIGGPWEIEGGHGRLRGATKQYVNFEFKFTNCKEYSQLRICRPPSSISEMVQFSWKMPILLKRMKNQISEFYFLNYGWLYLQITGDATGFSSLLPTKKKSFKIDSTYGKDAQWSETN